jgi:hypothetical protein
LTLTIRAADIWTERPNATRAENHLRRNARIGASRVTVHCADYKCGHSVTMYRALWPDNVRLSDLEERFVCTVCGPRGADVRPLTNPLGLGLVVRALNKLKRML